MGTPVVMLLPRKLLGLIYIAIRIFVAASKDYLDNLETRRTPSSTGRRCAGENQLV